MALKIVDKQWMHPRLHNTREHNDVDVTCSGTSGVPPASATLHRAESVLQPSDKWFGTFDENRLKMCAEARGAIEAQKCFYGIWASCLYSPTSSQHLLPSHQTPAFLYHGTPCFKAIFWFQVTLAKTPQKLGSPFSCLILSHPSTQYGMNFRQYAHPVYKNDTTGTFISYTLEILKNIARLKNIFSIWVLSVLYSAF